MGRQGDCINVSTQTHIDMDKWIGVEFILQFLKWVGNGIVLNNSHNKLICIELRISFFHLEKENIKNIYKSLFSALKKINKKKKICDLKRVLVHTVVMKLRSTSFK